MAASLKASTCNKIPSSLINPISQKLVNLYPLPNANNSALGYNYVNEPVRKLNEGEFDGRIDHNFSNNDYAFARFSYDQATSFVPGGSPGFAEANPVRQQSRHSQPWPQRRHLRNTRLLAEYRKPDQRWL